MKNIYILFFGFLLFSSCNLKERFDYLNKLELELQKEFSDPNINSTFSLSTGEESNFYQVTFYDYEFSNTTNAELKGKASLVNSYINQKIDSKFNFDYIEVRYTESNSEEAVSFTNFIFSEYLE